MPKYEVILEIGGSEAFVVEASSKEEAIEYALRGRGRPTNMETMAIEDGNHEATLIE